MCGLTHLPISCGAISRRVTDLDRSLLSPWTQLNGPPYQDERAVRCMGLGAGHHPQPTFLHGTTTVVSNTVPTGRPPSKSYCSCTRNAPGRRPVTVARYFCCHMTSAGHPPMNRPKTTTRMVAPVRSARPSTECGEHVSVTTPVATTPPVSTAIAGILSAVNEPSSSNVRARGSVGDPHAMKSRMAGYASLCMRLARKRWVGHLSK